MTQHLPDPRQHQGAQRVVHHRLVVHRQQLFAHRLGDRMQARAAAARQNDALAVGRCWGRTARAGVLQGTVVALAPPYQRIRRGSDAGLGRAGPPGSGHHHRVPLAPPQRSLQPPRQTPHLVCPAHGILTWLQQNPSRHASGSIGFHRVPSRGGCQAGARRAGGGSGCRATWCTGSLPLAVLHRRFPDLITAELVPLAVEPDGTSFLNVLPERPPDSVLTESAGNAPLLRRPVARRPAPTARHS